MLTEKGIVTSISTDTINVSCRSKIGCLRCAEGKGCGGGILASWLGDRQFSVQAHYDATVQAPKVGDFVAIAMPANRIVKLAGIMYGLPLAFMLLCLVILNTFFMVSDAFAIVLSILSLVLGFKLASFFIKKAHRKGVLQPRLIPLNQEGETHITNCKNKLEIL